MNSSFEIGVLKPNIRRKLEIEKKRKKKKKKPVIFVASGGAAESLLPHQSPNVNQVFYSKK